MVWFLISFAIVVLGDCYLPARKVARYYQIENKLEAIIKYELAKEVPLVK